MIRSSPVQRGRAVPAASMEAAGRFGSAVLAITLSCLEVEELVREVDCIRRVGDIWKEGAERKEIRSEGGIYTSLSIIITSLKGIRLSPASLPRALISRTGL